MNIDLARFNMIEQQIRTWEVLDPAVISALAKLRREVFVPPEYRELAFADMLVPLGFGEVMAEPRVEARMAQAASVGEGDRVLEIGTGSGFMAALLATLGGHVTSIELRPEFVETARKHLLEESINGVEVLQGDGVNGWPDGSPYDVIVISGSMPAIDIDDWIDQLQPGGRLVAVVGNDPIMEAILVTRIGSSSERLSLFDTVLPPLTNVEKASAFVF